MARPPRGALPDFGIFHVVSRGVGGIAIYVGDVDRKRFSTLLPRIASVFDWSCHAYCLMTTHYHLVVEAELANLSRGMAHLNSVYARAFNNRHGRFGHVFADRFSSYVLESEEHYAKTIRYVLDNPVRAGMCAEASDWPWSGVDLDASREQSLEKCLGTVPE